MTNPANTPRVVIYTASWCGYCRAAKSLLDERGIPYQNIDVTTDQEARRKAAQATGWPTIPIVLIDGTLAGGYSELAALDRRGGLAHLRA